jgi:uncharacterized membrane protein
MENSTKNYILTGLFTALVFILTFFLKIPVPYTSGYIHLGDSMIYLSVIVLGPVFGAFASGIGSMLADIAGGYVQYAVPTLIIKAIMAFIMGLILSGKNRKSSIASIFTACLVWVSFLSATIFYIKKQIGVIGIASIAKQLAGENADENTVKNIADSIMNLPVYLITGITILIIIFVLTAWIILKPKNSKTFTTRALIGMCASGMCMVMGYFLVESFMYSPIAAALSIPANTIQFFAGVLAAMILAPAVNKAMLSIQR